MLGNIVFGAIVLILIGSASYKIYKNKNYKNSNNSNSNW